MMNVSVIAVDVAAAAVHRLAGIQAGDAEVSQAVNTALEHRRS